jgi:glycine/D-amino acid oxidase-like deaminating enzyme
VIHDVIVVGGGPGGSTAAWRLARAGLRPLLLDAAVFPRVKICAGWVTPEALADVEIDPEKYPRTIQPFTACRFEFAGARYETRWRRPASYGIVRSEFDHHLLERARAFGLCGRRRIAQNYRFASEGPVHTRKRSRLRRIAWPGVVPPWGPGRPFASAIHGPAIAGLPRCEVAAPNRDPLAQNIQLIFAAGSEVLLAASRAITTTRSALSFAAVGGSGGSML